MTRSIILVPTYNEIENIELLIKELFRLSNDVDIMVIDDNSPDGTYETVVRLQSKFNKISSKLNVLKREKKEGLGKAYVDGFKKVLDQSKYSYICTMDADFSHNPKDAILLLKTAETEDLDLVIGSRYKTGINVVNWPLKRVLLSWFASKYVQFITRMPIKDATAGFNCYSARALRSLDLDKIKFVGYAFQIEMKYKIWRKKLKFKEVPIIFVNRARGVSKMDSKIFFEAFFGVIKLFFSRI